MSALTVLVGLLAVLVAAVGAVLLWALRALVGKEAQAVVPILTRNLIQRAAGRLPDGYRERFLEEWLGLLGDAIDERPLWALAEAASLYLRAGRIASELEPATVSVRVGATGRLNGFARSTARRVRSAGWIFELMGALAELIGYLLAWVTAVFIGWQLLQLVWLVFVSELDALLNVL